MKETILTNARIVTPDDHFMGALIIENDIIVDIQKGKHYRNALDLKGQWLIPGIIDIHTDYLEKELHPRPSASFPLSFAFHFLDARAISCGLTTVFCAVSFSDDNMKERHFEDSIQLVRDFDQIKSDLLARHFLHARLDPNTETVLGHLDTMRELKSLYLIVYNENIPGQRQFKLEDLIVKRAAMKGVSREVMKKEILEKIELLSKVNKRPEIHKALHDSFIIGSHDDTTADHVIEAKQYGATLSEMPTTIEAARKAKELGMWVCMGAPNYYRGGSHCGNLSCHDAMEEGLVDILCSDYHFPSLTGSFIKMIQNGVDPSKAINYVTLNPARLLKFDDLGSIETGKKADLVAFNIKQTHAAISHVFVDGVHKYNTNYNIKSMDPHHENTNEALMAK
jgi:alpha-D-ribose 1-methylphosphonate 5-triphosphate diphosphatase